MKKAIYLAVLASAIPLAACGGGSSSTLIPSGGSSIAVSTGAEALNQAVAGTSDNDKMGLTVSDANFSVAATTYGINEITSPIDTVQNAVAPSSYTLTSIKASASVSNFSASLLAEGLTATNVADINASLTASGDIAYDLEVTQPGSAKITATQSQSGVTAAAYISQDQIYLDASNAALVSLINGILGEVTSNESASIGSIAGGKYSLGTFLDGSSLPILGTDAISSLQDFGTQMEVAVNEFSTYFKAVQYTDGSYGLSISLTKDDIMSIALGIYDQEAQTSVTSLPQDVMAFFSDLTIASLSAGIVYTEGGLKSVTTDVDVSFAGTLGDQVAFTGTDVTLSSADAAKAVSFALKHQSTLNVLTGADVTVVIPDLAGYTAVNTDNSTN
jgi:hypothetical protein